ncbi:hypothetical protein, partial [Micromonospora sp. 4G55]|uniref:hypothetical protein n=1 Tax=Micromonospora sp. 4G55 TaxID=2806102 RepID=UPI001EE49112
GLVRDGQKLLVPYALALAVAVALGAERLATGWPPGSTGPPARCCWSARPCCRWPSCPTWPSGRSAG